MLFICAVLNVLLSISYEKEIILLKPNSSLIIGERFIKASLISRDFEIISDGFTVFGILAADKSPSWSFEIFSNLILDNTIFPSSNVTGCCDFKVKRIVFVALS